MNISIVGNNFSNYDYFIATSLKESFNDVKTITYKGFVPDRRKYDLRFLSFLFYYLISILSFPSRVIISIITAISSKRSDLVICINGSFLIPYIISSLGSSEKIAIWLMDPVDKFPRVLNLKRTKAFIFSYSEGDCRKFNFHFLPLFSAIHKSTDVLELANRSEKTYDLAFIGAVDLYRLCMLEEICRRSKHFYKKIYLGGVFGKLTLSKYLCNSSATFKNFRSQFNHKRHTFTEIFDIYKSAKVIFNYNVGSQSGSSMRFFESLCTGTPQIIDPIVANSKYSRLILKIEKCGDFCGFEIYRSNLDYADILKASSLNSRLQKIKKVTSVYRKY